MRSPYHLSELSLEGVYMWTEGGDDIAGEDVCHQLLFQPAQVGRGQVDSRRRHRTAVGQHESSLASAITWGGTTRR